VGILYSVEKGLFDDATFNNISVISWRSVLLVEETEDPEKTTNLSQVIDKLYQIMLISLSGIRPHNGNQY
jgi:hypothetical protein